MQKNLMGNILNAIYQFKWRLLGASLFLLVSNLLLVINPLIFRQALYATMEVGQETNWETNFFQFLFGSYFHTPLVWVILLLSLALISAVFKYQMRFGFFSISREIELDVRHDLYERIQGQSRTFFDRHGIGDLLSRLTNDITAYRDMLGPGLMYPIHFMTLVVPALITLFFLSFPLAMISTIPVIGIYIINLVFRLPLVKVSHQVQNSLSDMSVMTHEHYSGIRLIKGYGIEELVNRRFEKLCQSFGIFNTRYATFQGIFFPTLTLLTKLTTILLVIFAAAMALLNWKSYQLNIPDFLSFMWIQSYLFSPLLMLAWILPMYHKGKAAYGRLEKIYNEPVEIHESPEMLKHIPPHADIEFKNLSFKYPKQNKNILSNFSLHISHGTFLGITGPIGSGKSTLLKLLSREYAVPSKTLFIGNEDINNYSLEAFHRAIVTVEQLPFLFSKSIMDNIKFGKREATMNEVERVSKQANIHQDILEFPEQYETIIGERGVTLSGGQKQRMSIARAFLVNRSILLLDDIFSAVDTETEKKIFDTIRSNFNGKTIILVTHRASILEQMDRVIYMINGTIVDDGPPQELRNKKGPYKNLIELHRIHHEN